MAATLTDATTRHELFASTSCTLVLEAGANSSDAARAALEELCRIYWPAIYAFLRRRGYDQHDAQDLTQFFFQHVLENETLRRASRERGRFRNFLLGALKICLADEQAKRHALKRGGAIDFISMDGLETEELHHQQIARDLSPDESLDRRWARLVLDRAIAALRSESASKGKVETFEALSPSLAGEKAPVSYESIAPRIGVGLPGVKTLTGEQPLRLQFVVAVFVLIRMESSSPL